MYQKKSAYGGFLTMAVFIATAVMIWYEVQHYMTLKPTYSFDIDSHVGHVMQVNLDLTVNTPCSRLTIDLRDASGDALHFSEDDIVKDLSLIHISEPTRQCCTSRMPSSA